MGTVEDNASTTWILGVPQVRVGSMCWNESLRLGGHGGEHALLVETDTIVAASILRVFESGATNLWDINE